MDEASLGCRHTLMLVTPTKGIGPHSCVAAIAKTRFMACSPTFLWSEEFDGVSRVVVVVCRKARRVCFPVPAAHARARHVDDEGTYVRIKRRISYDA